MLCDSCGENEATVHLTQVIKGNVKKVHLCETCAESSGINVGGPMSLSDVLFGLGVQPEPDPGDERKKCGRCGMSLADFKKTQRLGCAACYETFAEELAPLLSGMQKGTQHVGKAPAGLAADSVLTPEIEAMQRKLQDAVTAEKYEEAAQLRDLIREERRKAQGGATARRRGEGG